MWLNSWQAKGWRLAVAVFCAILLGCGMVSQPAHAAPRSQSKALNCYGYGADVYPFDGAADFQTEGDGTCGNPPVAKTWVQNCSIPIDPIVNSDSWLTQNPHPGGARLAESGRSGLIEYPEDCDYHEATWVIGWGQYTTSPLYACGWFYYYQANTTYDYVCTTSIN